MLRGDLVHMTRPSRFADWHLQEKRTSHIIMTEGSGGSWSKVPI